MAETENMAENIHWFDTIDSTNTRLVALRDEFPDRTVFAARYQSAGRGQMGNRWESRAGENLTFSILLKPAFLAADEQFALSQAVALGVLDYLQGQGVPATVKWPNDLYAGDRKICGMLIETGLSDGHLAWAVAGIGLNVNQRTFDPSLPNPTSLALETGRAFRIEAELPALLHGILARCDRLESPYARNGNDAAYLNHLYRRGAWHWFEELPASEIPAQNRTGRRIEARILGIDPESRLLLEHRDGSLHAYGFKEIKYVL